MEGGEITAQNVEKKFIQNKPKVISSGEEFRRRLEAPIIKVICILWHTLTIAKKCGQLIKSNNTQTKLISPFEACALKLLRAKCSLASERVTSAATATVDPKISDGSWETETEERDIQFLWAEKWRPKRLEDFLCHKQQVQELQLLVSQRRCPHMIFEGPPGVGKTSLVRAMIQEIFRSEEQVIKHGKITIQLRAESETRIVVPIKATSNHIEINLSRLSGYEKDVISFLIKEFHKDSLERNMTETAVDYKVIVLGEADKLTSDVQQYIHWLMERYQDSCKLIFCCSTVNNLQSISSLCKVIEIKPPTNERIIEVLEHIAKKERKTLPRPFAQRIAENSDRNLRQAIRSLEACTRSQYPFIEDQKILTGWEDDITKIAKYIVEEQSPKRLYKIRGKLQTLAIHNVNPSFVFSFLVEELKRNLDDNLQMELYNLYVAFKGNSFNDGKPLTENQRTQDHVLHAKRNAYLYVKIEEFTARFMSAYKSMKMGPT